MRVSLVAFLLIGYLSAVYSATLGSEENPFPENHAASDDGEEAPDSDDEAGGENGEEEGGEEEESEEDPLQHYEEDGSSDMTEEQLRKLHAQMDHNGDGKLHVDEIMKFSLKTRHAIVKKEIAGVFDEIESTQDGHLSLEEHIKETAEFHEGTDEEKAHQASVEVAKFKAADVNNDDKLDVDELVHLMHPETHPEVLEVHTKEEMRKKDTDKDGRLSKKEWETDAPMGEHTNPDTHDPANDFEKLDANKDGFINMDELRHWESGRFHTEDAMKKLTELADKDGDKHLTADELANVLDELDGHDAHAHLLDWAFHDEM